MNKLIIRRGEKNSERDLSTLVEFQLAMALESENLKLERESLRKGIQRVIENFYLAIDPKTHDIVGCLLVQDEWSDWRNALVWWIHSVYVIPSFRRNGVYRQLYAYLRNEVEKREDLAGLRLYVDKSNLKAQKTYEELGMTDVHYKLYEWMKK